MTVDELIKKADNAIAGSSHVAPNTDAARMNARTYALLALAKAVNSLADEDSPGKTMNKLEVGCPACEFIVDTCRTTQVGGCGKHDA